MTRETQFIWHGATPILLPAAVPAGIRTAAADLARDMQAVFGRVVPSGLPSPPISLQIDASLPREGWQIVVDAGGLRITAADELGGIYALYDLSQHQLGIDPLWYWIDEPTPRHDSVAIATGSWSSSAAVFGYRGLFINDEDLLGQWLPAAGQRFGDWPLRETSDHSYHRRLVRYYAPVINASVMERVYETVLRLGGNMVIPASFVDVMNAPEAELIRAAVARGLYVSQHHVEPLGVGFLAYQSWGARQGKQLDFDYQKETEYFHAAWRAYVEQWWALAGEKVIWQIGLRGKGDRPAWESASFTRDEAAALADQAIAEQWQIIRSIDERPEPSTTLTCWLEVSEFLASGALHLPPSCIVIHSDRYFEPGRAMVDSFDLPRNGREQGCYLHLAVYAHGPHLVQGVDPADIVGLIDVIDGAGDRAYALINAANVREHAIALRDVFARLRDADAGLCYDRDEYALAGPLLRELFQLQRHGERWYHDSAARRALHDVMAGVDKCYLPAADAEASAASLTRAALGLQSLAARARSQLSMPFERWAIADQALILAGLYAALAALLHGDHYAALRALEPVVPVLERIDGRFRDWYRGDRKIGIRDLISRLEERCDIR